MYRQEGSSVHMRLFYLRKFFNCVQFAVLLDHLFFIGGQGIEIGTREGDSMYKWIG